MILVDANILLYAEDQQSPRHAIALQWWDAQLSGASPVCLCWTVFQKMLVQGQAVANLVTDAHLAALASEHGCELISTDTDFSRFPGVKWRNPLQ
ncbi:MAG: PIN domain-containing protein [Proteobacteria bacterium]|nr:PIN domain-containing protein [Pseudomonadota bacterium]MBU2227849.1 PIN domain-containing protein [Pseudomonadota bacterium]MBU2261184.1 PIN domain-containing protein [Pseudomonadota bacterium]